MIPLLREMGKSGGIAAVLFASLAYLASSAYTVLFLVFGEQWCDFPHHILLHVFPVHCMLFRAMT